MENKVTPLGFELAREMTVQELQEVGGGRAKGTAGAGVTVSSGGPDAEAHVDLDW